MSRPNNVHPPLPNDPVHLAHRKTVDQIASRLDPIASPDDFLECLVQEIHSAIPCDWCMIGELNFEAEKVTYLSTLSDVYVRPPTKEEDTALFESHSQRLFRENQALYVKDHSAIDVKWGENLKESGIRSTLSLPVIYEGHCVAVFFIGSMKPSAFDAHHEILLSSIAQGVAPSMREVCENKKNPQKFDRYVAIQNISQQINEILDLETRLEHIVQSAAEIVNADFSRLFLFDSEKEELHLRKMYARIPPQSESTSVYKKGEGEGSPIFHVGGPTLINDIDKDTGRATSKWFQANQIKSYIACPLRIGGERIGVINCTAQKKGMFLHEDLNLLQLFADHAATAIGYGRLLEESRENAERLEISQEIVQAINSELDPSELFAKVLSEIRRVVPCEMCVIASIDPETKKFEMWHHETDIPLKIRKDHHRPEDSWWQKQVYVNNRAFLIDDLGKISCPIAQHLVQAGFRSGMVFPILQDGKCIAHLSLFSTRFGAFSDQQKAMLASVASHVGIAIRNARLFRSVEERAERIAKLGELNQEISNHLDPDELLERIVESTISLIKSDTVRIFLVDEDSQELVSLAYRGISIAQFPSRTKIGERIVGKMIQSGKPIIIDNLSEDIEPHYSEWAQKFNLQSFIGHPINYEGKMIGAICCLSLQPKFFRPGDLSLLSTLTSHAGVAIQNAQAFAMTQKRAVRMGVTNRIAHAVGSILDPSELFRLIVEEIRAAVSCERCGIASIDLKNNSYRLFHIWADGENDPPFPGQLEESVRWIVREVYETKSPQIVSDFQESDLEWAQWRLESGFRSMLYVPILHDGKVFAHLALSSKHVGGFDEEDKELLVTISNHLGPAIRNANLFHETERTLSQLNVVGNIAKVVGSILEPEKLFPTIATEIRAAVPCDRCVVASLEFDTQAFHYWHHESSVSMKKPLFGPGSLPKQIEEEFVEWIGREVYEHQKIVNIPDLKASSMNWTSHLVENELKSIVFVPITHGDRTIAHMGLSSNRQSAFNQEHEQLLLAVSEYLGLAIQNATLFLESEKRISRLKVADSIAKAVNVKLEPDTLFKTIVREIRRAIQCDHCVIATYDPKICSFHIWAREVDSYFQPLSNTNLKENFFKWIVEEIYVAQKMHLIRDFRDTDLPWSNIRLSNGVLSGLHFPILHEGRCIAHLSMHSSRRDGFSKDDMDLLDSVSGHLALAIRNAELHNKIQRDLAIYQGAIQDNRNAIILQDPDRIIIHWNAGAEKIYGFSEEEVLGKKIDILFTPEDKERTKRGNPVFDHGASLDFEGERIRKDGSRIWVSVTLSPLLNDEGDVIAIFAVHKEVSPKKRLEESLRGAISDTLDWFPMGVVLLDDSRRLLHANRIADEILRDEDGLLLIDDMLGAIVEEDAEALSRLIYDVTNPVNGEETSEGAVILISRPSGLRPYSVLVGRHQDQSLGHIPQKVSTVIFISDPEMGHNFPAENVASLYGLTSAESHLLRLLVNGKSLEQIACERNTSVNTVRWQVRNIFRKTNTKRQSELVRLVLSSPIALSPPSDASPSDSG